MTSMRNGTIGRLALSSVKGLAAFSGELKMSPFIVHCKEVCQIKAVMQ